MSLQVRSRGISCPRCGGGLRPHEGDAELLACAWCGLDYLRPERGEVEALAPAGRLGRRRALRRLGEILREAGVEGFEVERARRLHLPFWHLEAKLVGWQRYRRRVRDRRRLADGREVEEAPRLELKEESFGHNVVHSSPACDLRAFGLLGVADRMDRLPLRPFDLTRLGPDETAFAVLRSRASLLREARLYHGARLLPGDARQSTQRITLVRARTRLLYYPVWQVGYRARGRSLEVVLDGVRGRLLRGQRPEAVEDHLTTWLLAGGLLGVGTGWQPVLAGMAWGAWTLTRLTRDGVSGRPGQVAAWLRRQVGGPRIVPRELVR